MSVSPRIVETFYPLRNIFVVRTLTPSTDGGYGGYRLDCTVESYFSATPQQPQQFSDIITLKGLRTSNLTLEEYVQKRSDIWIDQFMRRQSKQQYRLWRLGKPNFVPPDGFPVPSRRNREETTSSSLTPPPIGDNVPRERRQRAR